MTIYLKNKIKTLPGRNLHLVRLIIAIETFTINGKKLEKLGLGTLKNCMIYRRSDTHKIWTIVIWNGFVIIRFIATKGGGGWWTPVFSSKFDECTLLILVRPPEWTQGPWSRVQSISMQWYQYLFANGYNLCHWAHMYFERVCVTNNRIFTSV